MVNSTLTNNGVTSFGNDDYMADLDAENIFRKINGGEDSITAIREYYNTISGNSSYRVTFFKSYLGYSTVESMVLSELGKTLIQVQASYPDTYNFLMSFKNNLAEIKHYL